MSPGLVRRLYKMVSWLELHVGHVRSMKSPTFMRHTDTSVSSFTLVHWIESLPANNRSSVAIASKSRTVQKRHNRHIAMYCLSITCRQATPDKKTKYCVEE